MGIGRVASWHAGCECQFKLTSSNSSAVRMGKKKGSAKKKAQKAASNVFSLFTQTQIQEFKEAFNMIDQNRDGFISQEDLGGMFASMGKDHPAEYLEAMIKEASADINFTTFLTLFGEKLKRLLMAMGERFTQEEVDAVFEEQECDDAGDFDYIEFVRLIKHGPREEE